MKEVKDNPLTETELVALAQQHGLRLQSETFNYNETGLDFQVIQALDEKQQPWILRLPRRPDVLPRAKNEHRVLQLLQGKLPADLPDWQIFDPKLIAYPRLAGIPVANIDMENMCYVWNLDLEKLPQTFVQSLGQTIAALHAQDTAAAAKAGIKVLQPEQLREHLSGQMQRVKEAIGVAEQVWDRWQAWLQDDSYWPRYTCLVHGDLQAAHILTDENGKVNGLLDWTEAEVSDPAIDFVALLAAFGEDFLKRVLTAYEQAGGQIWPRMLEHVQQRHGAYGVNIGLFVLESGTDDYLQMAKDALGLSTPK
ncbi:macrolide 2'-phosphotransferase [Pontibacter sp. HSC-14F20]|uniref:macrolide 2'-phosphotransferase n=1 Tax=Pontibacter sp. HSC-14F20 TaxID=2864136 RepID=UPI001C73CC16|nr:macrolide 2'-phosphotransferase [Pontibacter sp. HSC-14F20]MBX0334230.1 macrolide 2'-phosphotransferase [Pontibacter sp. HSC-14F20]